MSEINLSFWNMDRIQREQEKHITPYAVNPIDKTRLDKAIAKDLSVVDSITNDINGCMRKVQEQSDMYRICEIAKLYIESQIPTEWEYTDGRWGLGDWRCSKCGGYSNKDTHYCPNCGRRMKI